MGVDMATLAERRAARDAQRAEHLGTGQAPMRIPSTGQSQKVRATQMGYYNLIRRREGDVFTLETDAHFSAKWMERVDPRTPERITTGKDALAQQHNEIVKSRSPGILTDADNPLGVE
jgi:hypothetical protein